MALAIAFTLITLYSIIYYLFYIALVSFVSHSVILYSLVGSQRKLDTSFTQTI